MPSKDEPLTFEQQMTLAIKHDETDRRAQLFAAEAVKLHAIARIADTLTTISRATEGGKK